MKSGVCVCVSGVVFVVYVCECVCGVVCVLGCERVCVCVCMWCGVCA